jgi:hypothetical protein
MVNKMQNYSISRKFAINIGVILLAISMILPVHVQAADTSMKFTPSADAFVLATSPDNNYGSNISLRVDNSPDTRSYLRFDVIGLAGSQIISAKLRVYANSANTTGYSVQVVDDTSWTESGITFQNAPPIGDEIVKSSSFKKAVWTEVDITPFITGDGTYNLALTTQNVTNTNLASREAGVTKAPQLVVSFGTVEPPVPTDPPAPTDIPTQQPTNLPTVVQHLHWFHQLQCLLKGFHQLLRRHQPHIQIGSQPFRSGLRFTIPGSRKPGHSRELHPIPITHPAWVTTVSLTRLQ